MISVTRHFRAGFYYAAPSGLRPEPGISTLNSAEFSSSGMFVRDAVGV